MPVNVLVIDPISNVASRSGGPPSRRARPWVARAVPSGVTRPTATPMGRSSRAQSTISPRTTSSRAGTPPSVQYAAPSACQPIAGRHRIRPNRPSTSQKAPVHGERSSAIPQGTEGIAAPCDTRRRSRMPRTSTRRPSAHHRTKAATGLKASHEPIEADRSGRVRAPQGRGGRPGGDREPRRARPRQADPQARAGPARAAQSRSNTILT